MVALHPYPRGFVIFRRDSSPTLPEGWSTVSLGDSEWVFAHDHLETPELVTVGDGDRWVLVHGLCLYAGDDERDMAPAQRLAELAATDESSFLDLLDVLGGRHVVLLGNADGYSLYQDATGMRSVYFSPEAELVGSHARLLNSLQEHRPRPRAQGRRGFLMAWDRTPYVGISALLPNHSLSLPNFHLERWFPRRENPYQSWSVGARVAAYIGLWERQWREFRKKDFNPVLSVTGGHDSRTNLALLSDHIRGIRTFTYSAADDVQSEWAYSVRLDEHIVEDIKKCITLDHQFFITNPVRDRDKSFPIELVAQNTVGKHGSWLLPYYLEHFSQDGVVHIRGNTYGVYKAPWGMTSRNNTLDSLQKLYMATTKQDRGYEPDKSRERHFQNGARRWQYLNDLHGYHRREIYYWEIRLGRWAAEIYNETDIVFPSFDPTNVRSMLELALSFSIPEKKAKLFQSELINTAFPILNFPGKNTTHNLYEQTRFSAIGVSDSPAGKKASGSSTDVLPPETSVTVAPGMTIALDGEILDWVSLSDSDLYMPTDHFLERSVSGRLFTSSPSDGSLTFAVEADYYKTLARDTWFYQVSVDGTVRARWDGALRGHPVHVTVSNVTPQSTIEFQIAALRNRQGNPSWESATRARITNARFLLHETNGETLVATDVPESNLESTTEKLTISVESIDQLTKDDFTPEFPRRVDVVTTHCVIPLLVVRRRGARRTAILCNGPVDLGSSKGKPVFQRSTWWPDIAHHQIYVCDPATVGDNAVSIAWGQYSPEYWSIPDTSQAVRAINATLTEGACDSPLYFGSSAGGFTALGLLAMDPKAHAIVNNAQFDWTTWYSSAVQNTRDRRLRSMPLTDLNLLAPERVDVLRRLAAIPSQASVDYWVNTALKHDRDVSLPHWERVLGESPHLHERMRCRRYHDMNAGSAPLGKSETITLLSESGPDPRSGT